MSKTFDYLHRAAMQEPAYWREGMQTEFWEQIERHLSDRKMTHDGLTKQLGWSRGKYERARSDINLSEMAAILKAIRCDIKMELVQR